MKFLKTFIVLHSILLSFVFCRGSYNENRYNSYLSSRYGSSKRDLLMYTYPRGGNSDYFYGDDDYSKVFQIPGGLPLEIWKYTSFKVHTDGYIYFPGTTSSFIFPYKVDLYPTNVSNGRVYTKTYTDQDPDAQDILQKATRDVLLNSDNPHFRAKWVAVTTWWNVKFYGNDKRVSVQCVLMTDHVTTYAVFDYIDVNVGLTASVIGQNVTIGWEFGGKFVYNEHAFKDTAFKLSTAYGNTGQLGVWFYELANDKQCLLRPCQHGATCHEKYPGYNCSCTSGFTGANCQLDINECLSSPCVHGQCVNTPGSYHCDCDAGFTSKHCEKDIDECNAGRNPCHNGGTCSNSIGSFSCRCAAGWTGKFCDQDINECLHSPCIYGSCVNTQGSYHCDCISGIGEKHCDTDLDECQSAPCKHGGTCVNGIGSFTCDCSRGWVGPVCNINSSLIHAAHLVG